MDSTPPLSSLSNFGKNSFKRRLSKYLFISFVALTFMVIPFSGAMMAWITMTGVCTENMAMFASIFSSLMTVWSMVIVHKLMSRLFDKRLHFSGHTIHDVAGSESGSGS
jgi:uncharacterized membrane protein